MNIDCPFCSSNRRRVLAFASAMLDLHGNTDSRVYVCEDCGLRYLWPGFAKEGISAMYEDSYFLGTQSRINDSIDLPATDSNYASEFVPVRLEKFNDTVNLLRSLSPSAQSILDIGAATGDFLAIARDKGLSVSGIEISRYASSVAREKHGFDFFESDFLDYPLTKKFDLIHMNHVFEHFPMPNPAIDKIDTLLNPGGLVYIEVPFQFNLVETIMYICFKKRKKYDVFSLHHPVFYTPGTLKKIFSKHGYKCRTMRLFSWSRYKAESLPTLLKKLIWGAASLFGQGIHIEAVFERNS